MLFRSPVALALPAIALTLWIVVERRRRDIERMSIGPGVLIVLAIVVPWYAADYAQHGLAHLKQFLIGENLARYASSMAGDRNPLFYLPVLFADLLFPWAPLALMPMLHGWKTRVENGETTRASIRRLLWLWVVVIVAVFSFSQTKEDLYILPAVPALAALGAEALVEFDFGRHSRSLLVILAVTAGVIALCGLAVYRVVGAPYLDLAGATSGAVVLAAGGAAMLAGLAMRRPRAAVVSLAAAFVLFNYFFVGRILPASERYKPVPELARTFKERAAPSATLASYRLMLPSLVYYADHPVADIDADDSAREYFARSPAAWAITSDGDYERLRTLVPALCVVERRPRLDITLRNVLAGAPMPEALLVTNQCQK